MYLFKNNLQFFAFLLTLATFFGWGGYWYVVKNSKAEEPTVKAAVATHALLHDTKPVTNDTTKM